MFRASKFGIVTSGSGFLTDPNFELVRGKAFLRLKEPLGYRFQDGQESWIYEGFEFDGASIPRFAWSIIDHPFADWLVRGACWHDFHCEMQTYSSKFVHRTFYDMIRFDAETRMQRQVKAPLCFRAVDLFGPRWTSPVLIAADDPEGGV
jgi:hypothetical protein